MPTAVSPRVCSWPSYIKQPCSNLQLPVSSRLLDPKYIDPLYLIECMVRIVISIWFLKEIDQDGRAVFLLVEGMRNTASIGPHSLNGLLWQVLSCFSRLTSYPHTAIGWIGRECSIFCPHWCIEYCHPESPCLPVTRLFTLSSFLVCAC